MTTTKMLHSDNLRSIPDSDQGGLHSMLSALLLEADKAQSLKDFNTAKVAIKLIFHYYDEISVAEKTRE